MLKYIGIILIVIGAVSLAYSIYKSKKDGIKEARQELAMITSAGYVSTHEEKARNVDLYKEQPIKVPPRKRTLSKEAMDLLNQVEAERENERIEEANKKSDKPSKNKKKNKNRGTDILMPGPKKGGGTDILQPGAPKERGTDVLDTGSAKGQSGRSTDVLPSAEPSSRGTDVLAPVKSEQGTDVLPSGGTDVLIEQGSQTDTLIPASPVRSTDVLVTGTDVLLAPEKAPSADDASHSTDVLMENDNPKGSEREYAGKKFRRKEVEFWKTAKDLGYKGGTGILEKEED